ncbi:hypothetical protein CNR22_03825 [Sphingobacteriaceae bacterium]|nr:hypothetical protein CNR22_03825 [Sphingobacteriaceae bacterium]
MNRGKFKMNCLYHITVKINKMKVFRILILAVIALLNAEAFNKVRIRGILGKNSNILVLGVYFEEYVPFQLVGQCKASKTIVRLS